MTDGPSKGACLDCKRRYGAEYGFPDLIVPDWVWEKINPGSDGAGLLCPSCICARAYEAGVAVNAYFASGPFVVPEKEYTTHFTVYTNGRVVQHLPTN